MGCLKFEQVENKPWIHEVVRHGNTDYETVIAELIKDATGYPEVKFAPGVLFDGFELQEIVDKVKSLRV